MTIFETDARFHDLTPLLRPRSIAVIGASEQPGNLGGVAVSLMRKFGYGGEIWPVNPKRDTVHGLRCYPSPEALPRPADLALIATSAELAVEIVRSCAAAGIRYGIIWAGGYAETGEAGARLQDALVAACLETGFVLVGPNCIGIINGSDAMVASFASFLVESTQLLPGNIAMISQSGGLATMAQALAQRRGVGFGLTVSTGNEAVLTVADYIYAVAADDRTKVVAAYIEGVRDGPRFIEAVGAARRAGKPVVVLKGGLSATSAQAAAAHTGALTGERRVWEAVARQLGTISANSLEELIDICVFLGAADLARLPAGGNVAVVSFGGGSGVLAADLCEARGLAMPQLGKETREQLRKIVTPIASVANPVDLTPQTVNQQQWFDHFPQVLDTIAADPAIDIVLMQFGPQAQRGAATAKAVADFVRRCTKNVCLAWPLAPAEALAVLADEGVQVFEDYDRAIATLARLAEARKSQSVSGNGDTAILPLDWNREVPDPKPGLVIGENECHRILANAGIAVASGRLATSEGEAVIAASALGFPLAAKGISSQVTHRAAAGLVALDLRGEEAIGAVVRDFSAKAKAGGYALDGVYFQKMAEPGLDIIVSAFRDPNFGVMVTCGAGGNLTELMEDSAIASAPLSMAQAEDLLNRLRITGAAGKLGRGARMGDLAGFVSHFSRVAAGVPWRKFVIELNPVRWNGDGAVAVDGLIIIDDPES